MLLPSQKYNLLMKARVAADFQVFVHCTAEDAADAAQAVESIVTELKRLLPG